MDLNTIGNLFTAREVNPLEVTHKFAVLIPLIYIDGKLHIIFENRSPNLKSQPNEVSFPGGKIERGETPKEAAVRETMEELNLTKTKIIVLGETDYLVSKELYAIDCFVGVIENIEYENIKPCKDEVESIFAVPLDFFLNNEPVEYTLNLYVEHDPENKFPYHLIPDGKNYDWHKAPYSVYFYTYEDHVIWGFTAKMMYHFVNILKENKD